MGRWKTVVLLSLALAGAAPAAGAQTAEQGAALAEALGAAEGGDWTRAGALAARSGAEVAPDLILWLRLREGVGDWDAFQAFLARNPGWPNRDLIRRHAERAMSPVLPPQVVIGFFRDQPPLTGSGALRLAEALAATGRPADAQKEVVHAWRTMSLSEAERRAILAAHEPAVAPQDVARLDMLLWRGLTAEALAMLPRVSADQQALARARIAVRQDAEGSSAAIAAAPAALRDTPGLAYERYRYRVEKGRWDEAEAFLLERSTSAEALGRPDHWMERRANLARQALQRGDVSRAYALAAHNYGDARSGPDYADAEWVAGYIALIHREDPRQAAGHFERFRAAVATPISLGRAGYWLGLAYERAGEPEKAQEAYRSGARHQTSFYGQLAAERIGAEADARIAGHDETTSDWRAAPFLRERAVQAGLLLAAAGDDARAMLFLRQAARSLPPDQRAALAQMQIDEGRPHMGLRMAKDAAADGVMLPAQYYPLHAMAEEEWPVPGEFALAIARQESEFDAGALSPAGARGLMQLMPGTARETAAEIGAAYDPGRLSSDPLYNAALGTAYLRRMLETYGGSYILAAAAYNAGPGRVGQWIAQYGDPRGAVDAVRWIESIPFEETRNYVMRVLESLHVYRARLRGETPPLQLASDINRAT